MSETVLETRRISKRFGSVVALKAVSFTARGGEVTCLLGDNGAGKSTFIKILAGVHRPDQGSVRLAGKEVRFATPREALDQGIATVYQDLALIPLMPVFRNFFLGREPVRGRWPFRNVAWKRAAQVADEELRRVGIHLRNPRQTVGTLSGGERQSVAIARALHFGARVLILDEPTSALGVREAALVLRLISEASARGLAVIFITHNVTHAHAVGDKFTVLNRGEVEGSFNRDEISRAELQDLMAGSQELSELADALGRDVSSEVEGFERA